MNNFWEVIASNAAVASILAVVAALAGRAWKNAAAVHVLWVVVLLKLFTPPLVTTGLPIDLARGLAAAGANPVKPPAIAEKAPAPAASALAADHHNTNARGNPAGPSDVTPGATAGHGPWSPFHLLAALWACGSCGMALVHALAIRRFARLIREFGPAPAGIAAMADQLAKRLGLGRVPVVLMTDRALPPLVWSIGPNLRVILPAGLFARMGDEARRTIIAHELAHVRRGDHLVRLLEVAATTVYWWHPAVWWASRRLRELEEQCCDGRVLELVPHPPRAYAAALVDTLEYLSGHPRATAPLRTAFDDTGSLLKRITMLTHRRPNRLNARAATIVAALVALPMALAFAAEPSPRPKPISTSQPADVPAAVLRGRVTDEGGAPLADARVRVAIPAADMLFADERPDLKLFEARTDAKGDYRLEVPGVDKPTTASIDAMKPGHRRLVGTLMSGGDPKSVELVAGKEAEAALILKPAIYFKGVVVDEQGRPIPNVEVAAIASGSKGNFSAGVERTVSRPDGSFELFNYNAEPFVFGAETSKSMVLFGHPDYLYQTIDDLHAVEKGRREALRVVLGSGFKVTGVVVDAAGKPAPHVMVKAVRKEDGGYRKAAMTDVNGRFALRGLVGGLTSLTARSFEIKQKAFLPLGINADKDVEVRLQPLKLPADLKTYDVLGMKLADVTPDLKAAYDLFHDGGALIIDPGADFARLGIGEIVEGDNFWMAGKKRVGSVREFVAQVLQEIAAQDTEVYSVRIVYSFSRVDLEGTNTQYMKLTKDDRKQLQALLDRLDEEPK